MKQKKSRRSGEKAPDQKTPEDLKPQNAVDLPDRKALSLFALPGSGLPTGSLPILGGPAPAPSTPVDSMSTMPADTAATYAPPPPTSHDAPLNQATASSLESASSSQAASASQDTTVTQG